MAHVFVAPHPDDAALSCGGLIASLRELGQDVTVLTLYSGTGSAGLLTPYQREALGFGTPDRPEDAAAAAWGAGAAGPDASRADADAAKPYWQHSSWSRRTANRSQPRAGQPLVDDQATQGAVLTQERVDAAAAGETMARRRLEDERFAAFAEVSTVFLDLPDAVFRGYEGDDELLGAPRADDPPPVDLLRREIARLEPSRVYFPMGIGGHVDHQLARDAGLALLADRPSWTAPLPSHAGRIVFYEDFPYAHWEDFGGLDDMPPSAFAPMPAGMSLEGEFSDVSGVLERKIRGIALYESQMERLFGGLPEMADAVRAYAGRLAAMGSVPNGAAERYWVTTQA